MMFVGPGPSDRIQAAARYGVFDIDSITYLSL